MNKVLLIIDPQKDFIDDPNFMGALAVNGAYDDMKRLSKYILDDLPSSIVITMDTHAKMHIANPMWWVDQEGQNPSPFTLITAQDIKDGRWKAVMADKQEHSLNYVETLEKEGKYKLFIWPYHCINGTEGHKVSELVLDAITLWEEKTGNKVQYVFKGENPNTEHYSGLKAEVVMVDDKSTDLNEKVVNFLNGFDVIEVAGEAQSHCVKSTVNDLIEQLGAEAKKITLLKNCMSSVTGFEKKGMDFLEKAQKDGCSVKTVAEVKKAPKLK